LGGRRPWVLDWGVGLRGKVNDEFAVHGDCIRPFAQVTREHLCGRHQQGSRQSKDKLLLTLPAQLEVDHIGYLDVDDTEEALVRLSLELALVEDLDCNDRRVLDGAAGCQCDYTMRALSPSQCDA
jgi:hypothetical protein